VAFYAIGAYLWAFFGSQQPYLLHEIPGTAPPGTPFFLPADAFFLGGSPGGGRGRPGWHLARFARLALAAAITWPSSPSVLAR